MKKYFLSIVALAGMLFATSCQESLVEPQVGGPTTFTVQVPDGMGTKAGGDSYKLFVEVYSADGSASYHRIEAQDMAVGTATTVTLNLVANQEYDIIFWAQKNADSYVVDDLRTVLMNAKHHNSETGAAFYAVLNNYNPTQGKKDVKLTRPFAQLNLYTTNDVAYGKVNLVKSTITIEGVAEKFNRVNQNGETFGEGVGSTTYTYTSDILPTTGTKEIGGVVYQYVSMDYLAVPGNQNLVKVTAVIDVEDGKGNTSQITRVIEQVPVQMNYRTNIIGNLITSASDFKVEISEDWAGEDKTVEFREVSTADELIAAVNAGVEEIVLVADIKLDQPLVFGTQPQSPIARASATETPSSFVLDLGNRKISNPNGYVIENYADLTIKADVDGGLNGMGVIRSHKGKITIEGGEYTASSRWQDGQSQHILKAVNTEVVINDGIFDATIGGITNAMFNASENGIITINGGTFRNVEEGVVIPQFAPYMFTYEKNGKLIINDGDFYGGWRFNGETATTDIYGGTFTVSYDGQSFHANSTHVLTIYGGVFSLENGAKLNPTAHCAEGYQAVLAADGKSYVVLPNTDNYDIVITAPAQLTKEVIKEYSNIYLAAAGEYFVDLYDIDYKETLTITGTEGVKFAHTADNYGQLRIEEIQNFTIRNCEILKRRVGNKNWGMMVFSTGRPGGRYTIENCTFNGVGTQGIYINEKNSSAVYHIKNCTFNDDFGTEGAITISTHQGVNHTVNVIGCEFNNVPADHRIFLTKSTAIFYDFTLNTDLKATTADELEMFLNLSNQVNVAKGNYTFPATSIKEGQTIICEEGTVFTETSSLNINGAKVINATFSNPNGSAVSGTINGVFENCTFTGSNALRWCYAGETVEFINCVFDGTVYGVHFDGGANEVIFENCVLSGFNGFGAEITSLTFNDCIFKSNGRSGYNGANLWCGATMTNCEFTFDGTAGTEWIDCINADGTYIFDNCTIGGNNYTSSNYANYEQIFSRNNATVTINGEECEL